jgi:putative hydroxymethylpyrimidine transport system substrate-binding protein
VKRIVAALLACVVLAVLLSACDQAAGGGAGSEGGPQKLTVALDWQPNTFHYWFFAALENGYFEERDLEIDYVIPDAAATSIKLVGTDRAQVGISPGVDAIGARDSGIPIRVVNTVWPRPPFGVIARAEEVPQFDAIEGKTVGILSTDYDRVCFNRLLEEHGMSEEDVNIVDPGFNLVPPLLSGELAMVTGSDNFERVIAEEESGEDVNWWADADVCPYGSINMFANERWASRNAETLRAFNVAALEGLAWSMENPEEARDIFVKRFPEAALSPELELAMWEATVPTFCAPYTDDRGLGYSDPEQWRELIDLMTEAGVVEGELPVEELTTNEYLPEEPVRTEECA